VAHHEFVGMTKFEIMTTRILALVVAVAFSFGGTAASATNLKPFDSVALRATVEATAKALMLPGTMVLLRTPQGEFVFGYGARRLDAAARRYAF
jgi:D-alanyl-D-alanine carboxypeptidase